MLPLLLIMKAKKYTTSKDIEDENSAYFNLKTRPRLMMLSRKSKKDGKSVIYLEVTVLKQMNGKTVRKFKRIATKERVSPDDWSQIKEEVKPRNPDHREINRRLEDIISRIKDYANDKIEDAVYLKPLPSEIQTLDKYFNKKNRKNLISYLEDYILLRQSNSVRGTWKEFRTLKGRLEKFQEWKNTTLYFESINYDFADNLRLWGKKEDLDPNTLKKTFEALTTFLNAYYDDQKKFNFFLSDEYKKTKFKAVTGTHASDPMPLYPDEIKKLIDFKPKNDLNFTNTKGEVENIIPATQEKLRKLFLISCFTGLRFSDVLRLTKGNVHGNTIIIRPSKTDKKNVGDLHIPLSDAVRKILVDINYDVSSIALTNQNSNKYLKVILKHLGINEMIKTYDYNLNGGRTESDMPKSQLVTFHCGRDTFITNCLIAGVEITTVMSWSGHTRFDTFQKYLKLSDTFKQVQHVKANNFFNFAKK